jgi:hypothetical protein
VASGGISSYFHIEDYGKPEIKQLFQELIGTLPSWMEQLWKKEIKLDGDEIVKHIIVDQGKWFDPYMVSYNGTDPKGGGEIITESKKGTPCRQHLSVPIHGLRYSPLHKRCVEVGFGYGNLYTAKPWLGFRCLRDYPYVMDLGVAIWRRLHHHFDGSNALPEVAMYFCTWVNLVRTSIHTKTTHQGQLYPKRNSQILGSSALVVSLFHPLSYYLYSSKGKSLQRMTEHMSAYILRAGDDGVFKHSEAIPVARVCGSCRDCLRLVLAYHWCSDRQEVFAADGKDWRSGHSTVRNPNKIVEEQFSGSDAMQEIFKR